jgi:hypothetical protein
MVEMGGGNGQPVMAVTLPGRPLKRVGRSTDLKSMPIRRLLIAIALIAAGCAGGAAGDNQLIVPSTILLPAADDQAPSTLFVADLAASQLNQGPTWLARVVVSVTDTNDRPVAGAVVSGVWSEGETGAGSCTTDVLGECELESSSIRKRVGSVELTIDSVEHAGLGHASELDAAGLDEDPGTITIAKP